MATESTIEDDITEDRKFVTPVELKRSLRIGRQQGNDYEDYGEKCISCSHHAVLF